MSVAIIQGSSGAQGFALTKHLLSHTSLKVYALTHRKSASELIERLGGASDRLTVLEGVDVQEERGLETAAETVKGREGKASVRLVACLAGIVRDSSHDFLLDAHRNMKLHPEKSLAAVDPITVSSSFAVNTIGHLLTYKHFVPLIPTKKEFRDFQNGLSDKEDPAKGLVGAENSLCWSLSARIGSITDNAKGGWYSYRA
jgi:NAD(P)-dependent dehydrogenase (short-subunit alcohol dehydrogenase family)